jgi:acetyltransferase-like isoleucine patch superfamily enzyme
MKLISKIFKLTKWPFYLSMLYTRYIFKYTLYKKNIIIGSNVQWIGIPIFQNYKDSIIKIGENCLICSDANYTALGVSHKTIIRNLNNKSSIIIGDNVRMSGTTICSSKSITIGNRCVIGSDVIIADTDFHSLDPKIRCTENDSVLAKSLPIIIGNNVFIGTRSIILKGVSIGNNSVIGAGSVVTKTFPENSIIGGNPAIKLN